MAEYLTDDECGEIVRASIAPDRILAGPDGWEGSEPDVLLTTVEAIVARHVEAERERIAQAIERYADSEAVRTGHDGTPGMLGNWVGGIRDAARIARGAL